MRKRMVGLQHVILRMTKTDGHEFIVNSRDKSAGEKEKKSLIACAFDRRIILEIQSHSHHFFSTKLSLSLKSRQGHEYLKATY